MHERQINQKISSTISKETIQSRIWIEIINHQQADEECGHGWDEGVIINKCRGKCDWNKSWFGIGL